MRSRASIVWNTDSQHAKCAPDARQGFTELRERGLISPADCSTAPDSRIGGCRTASRERVRRMLLRIDTSIQIAGANADDGAIVVAVTTMAHAFGRKVIAEGAEPIEPIRRLIDIGCLQGRG